MSGSDEHRRAEMEQLRGVKDSDLEDMGLLGLVGVALAVLIDEKTEDRVLVEALRKAANR